MRRSIRATAKGRTRQNCPGCPAITRPGGNLGKATNQPQWYDETRLQFVDAVSMTRGNTT